jgi:hypothetical protein
MNTNSYNERQRTAEAAPPGEHIAGRPSQGLTFIWIVWLLAAAVLIFFGAMIFVGIVSSVS